MGDRQHPQKRADDGNSFSYWPIQVGVMALTLYGAQHFIYRYFNSLKIEKTSEKPYTILPLGTPGVGKSNLCNKLIGEEGKFKSFYETSSESTYYISSATGPALGIAGNQEIKIYDTPGVGDVNINYETFIKEIQEKIPHSETIDAAIMVIKSTDYRVSL